MARLIDADEIPFAETTLVHTGEKIVWIGKHSIDAMPTVDAVQVVRCRDCKNNPDLKTRTKNMLWCRKWQKEVRKTDFCSYGERKEE